MRSSSSNSVRTTKAKTSSTPPRCRAFSRHRSRHNSADRLQRQYRLPAGRKFNSVAVSQDLLKRSWAVSGRAKDSRRPSPDFRIPPPSRIALLFRRKGASTASVPSVVGVKSPTLSWNQLHSEPLPRRPGSSLGLEIPVYLGFPFPRTFVPSPMKGGPSALSPSRGKVSWRSCLTSSQQDRQESRRGTLLASCVESAEASHHYHPDDAHRTAFV